MLRGIGAASVLFLVHTTGVEAQTTTLDQGRFLLQWRGQSAGTESFAIRSTGSGAGVEIVATAEIDTRDADGRIQLLPLLQMRGPALTVVAYQVRVSGDREEEVVLSLADRRFLSRVQSPRGEREREYRATPETVVIDPLVVHSFYVLANRFAEGQTSVPAISPRENRQFDLRIREANAAAPLTIAGTSVQARLLEIEGGGLRFQLWVDAQGRILQMAEPEAGRLATRESLP
jgi:hypothetical protein